MDLTDPNIWISLLTLTALEIVLGIDNIIFIAVVVGKLPAEQQARARVIGLSGALVFRVILLTTLVWIIGLTRPIADIMGFQLSWRDIILFFGGLFLLWKGTGEIHDAVVGEEEEAARPKGGTAAFGAAIAQIIMLDVIFSIDSVVTAVGMTDVISVMIAAVIIAIIVMMVASGPISDFIHRYPTTKMLALSFLLLVGVALIADGLHFHIPRGYLYFAIAFSVGVEALNLAAGRKRKKRA